MDRARQHHIIPRDADDGLRRLDLDEVMIALANVASSGARRRGTQRIEKDRTRVVAGIRRIDPMPRVSDEPRTPVDRREPSHCYTKHPFSRR